MEKRVRVILWGIVIVTVIILGRLFTLQVIDRKYKISADNNALRRTVLYPPRGEVYDRNGEFLVQSKEAYDLVAIPRDVKPFDTILMSGILGVEVEDIRNELEKARKFSPRRSSVLFKQLPKEVKLRFEEYDFPGFYTVYRTVRYYPTQLAGNLLGYIGEVNDQDIARDLYYRSGDYIGKTGIELSYESVLRGEKGVKIEMVDVHGIPQGSYGGGIYDTLPTPGRSIVCTINGKVQALAEELLKGKVGSVVAIEPATGEILVLASSPTYDPDKMVGRDRSKNYSELLADKRQPLFNRAIMAGQNPPGSTFKTVHGLIALQEGILTPDKRYDCHGRLGYVFRGGNLGCHDHFSPLNLREAVQVSCNAYFCYVFRSILEDKATGNVKRAYDKWREYVMSFGFGRKLETDLVGEQNGNVPPSEYYDRIYRGSWNALTVISLSIGQGELGATPLQVANLAATIANRGHYYIPHVVKAIEGQDSIDLRFYERHTTMVDPKYFDPIVEGMYRAVHNDGGTSKKAYLPGFEVCGKTGTAQNPHGADHSTFMAFAPMNDPKIAISVYIENGGFGATVAVPIASLLMELYLTDTITRPMMVQEVKDRVIRYPIYDK